jgi:S-adenosylmethionine decarboxylase proenzyme
MQEALATHVIIDFSGCDPGRLGDAAKMRTAMLAAVRACGATIVTDVFHQFSPHGVSGVVVISESHAAIHTWPERGFAAVDVFSCNPNLDFERLARSLTSSLKAASSETSKIDRGPRSAASRTAAR